MSKGTKLKDNSEFLVENEYVSIDLTLLYDVSGSDINFIHSTVQTFLKNMPDTINKIEQSLKMHDWENVYKLAHSAKSSLSVIYIKEMFDWIIEIEADAKSEKNHSGISNLLQKISEKFINAKDILNERFEAKNDISR